MQYNLSSELDKQRFITRAGSLIKKGAIIELVERAQRTKLQNNYLHLILGVVAMETGNTIEYTKQEYFKRLVNGPIFVQEKEDRFLGKVTILRSSTDLTKEEMSTAIDRFQRWAAENGIYIPDPADEARLRDIEIEMGRLRAYL